MGNEYTPVSAMVHKEEMNIGYTLDRLRGVLEPRAGERLRIIIERCPDAPANKGNGGE